MWSVHRLLNDAPPPLRVAGRNHMKKEDVGSGPSCAASRRCCIQSTKSTGVVSQQAAAVFRIRIHRIHMFLGLSQRCGSGTFYQPSIIKQISKNNPTLTLSVLWLLLDFLSLKNYVKVIRKTFLNKFLLASWRSITKIAGSGSASGSSSQKHGSPSTSKCHGTGTLGCWLTPLPPYA